MIIVATMITETINRVTISGEVVKNIKKIVKIPNHKETINGRIIKHSRK
jgi:hypothetical protein